MQYQIRLAPDGMWHRREQASDRTACGEEIHAFESRDWQLSNDLCPVCFTRKERDTGEMLKLEREALKLAEADAFREDEESTDPQIVPLPKSSEPHE